MSPVAGSRNCHPKKASAKQRGDGEDAGQGVRDDVRDRRRVARIVIVPAGRGLARVRVNGGRGRSGRTGGLVSHGPGARQDPRAPEVHAEPGDRDDERGSERDGDRPHEPRDALCSR